MSLVHTKLGLLEKSTLEVRDIVDEGETSRAIATEWYLGEELVRRDAWVNMYQGLSSAGEQAKV